MPRMYLAVCALLLIGTAMPPSLSAQAPPALPRPGDTGPDTLVQTKAAAQQARQAVFQRKGVEGRLIAMRQVVEAHFRAPRRSEVSITGSEHLASLDAEEVAQFLSSLGYNPADLRGSSSRGQGLVASAAAVLFGNSTIEHEIEVSPIVVVGRLQGVTPRNLEDGYRSTAAFEVITSVKGELPLSSTLQLRQRSGPSSDGEVIIASGEFQPGMTGDYLLFISPEVYHLRAITARDDPQMMAAFLLPYRVVDGVAHATGPGQKSSGFPVSSLRS